MARRGNRRRKKGGKKRTNVSWTPQLEQVVAQRHKARVGEDVEHERREELLERKGEERREQDKGRQRDVFVSNINYRASAQDLKSILEDQYGQVNEIRLYEDKRWPGMSRHKGCGVVTFDSPSSAADAVHDESIAFCGRTLRIKMNNPNKGQRRPSSKIAVPMLSLDVGVIRDKKWLSAWSAETDGSAIDFAVDGSSRKLYCRFQKAGTTYEIQIYMKEVVGNVILQRECDGHGSVSLFINVWRCPKVFREAAKIDVLSPFADVLSYRRNAIETVRTVDPTGDGQLGSFLTYRICLLRHDDNFWRVLELLSHYHVTEVPARIHDPGYVVASSLLWSPNPSYGARFSFLLRYELESLAIAARINKDDFNEGFLCAVSQCEVDMAVVALRKMTQNVDPKNDRAEDMAVMFAFWLSRLSELGGHLHISRWRGDDEETCHVLRVAVTPMRIVVLPQEIEMKNRVLRLVSRDRLLRLQFTDENFSLLNYKSLSTDIMARIRSILDRGIDVCGRRFVFLAFSSSQPKEHGCWMVSETETMTADSLRCKMGDFSSIFFPGKMAARMGQCFSTTFLGSQEELAVNEWDHIQDVERNGFCFSDGVGTISTDLLNEVATKRGYNMVPSAIQIRIGGVKGVLCHDPILKGRLICTRPSQEKFAAPNSRHIEICSRAQFLPCFLNRQLITLLSTLGVQDHAFVYLQDNMIQDFHLAESSDEVALRVLRQSGSLELAQHMLETGISVAREPFLLLLFKSLRAQRLQELQLKTRILVPDGCLLMGVMDETGTLEYGQCFVQIQRRHDKAPTIINQKVVVGKNPCLHPGDILRLDAVDAPQLHHLINVVVFPQKGERPHPDETSGSDLDGDQFSIIWDVSLFPSKVFEPMNYKGATPKTLDRPVTIDDITSFFCDFILNDNLGAIANAHLAIADRSPEGALDPVCLNLAMLHSMAVDFPKTGVPAILPKDLGLRAYPDFMEKKDKASYKSPKVIGKLFRSIKYMTRHGPSRRSDGTAGTNGSTIYDPLLGDFVFEDSDVSGMLEDALRGREIYNQELISIMNQFGIHNEGEVMTGFVLKFYRRYSKSKKKFDVMERVKLAVKALERRARLYFEDAANNYIEDDMNEFDQQLVFMELASTFYYVTYHPSSSNELGLLSFPWVSASDHLCRVFEFNRRATLVDDEAEIEEEEGDGRM